MLDWDVLLSAVRQCRTSLRSAAVHVAVLLGTALGLIRLCCVVECVGDFCSSLLHSSGVSVPASSSALGIKADVREIVCWRLKWSVMLSFCTFSGIRARVPEAHLDIPGNLVAVTDLGFRIVHDRLCPSWLPVLKVLQTIIREVLGRWEAAHESRGGLLEACERRAVPKSTKAPPPRFRKPSIRSVLHVSRLRWALPLLGNLVSVMPVSCHRQTCCALKTR